ncbi:g11472 [Coccomyxa viridis]|uniref:Molybdopterin synthase catalytic subunit n=1 Tax=Coccomyxa viridis TaxID=1274662 RepID=A0ABP1GC63_9CHLO
MDESPAGTPQGNLHELTHRINYTDIYVLVTPSDLKLDPLVGKVSDDGAGAVATFSGVTRDTFNGKGVLRLEYEAYEPMALKKMAEICGEAAQKWSLKKVAMAHRTGLVGIGHPSVIIAASSAHRADALEACHWAIDELKARVPIWKKEFYEGGDVWKENAESRQSTTQQQ